MIRPANRKPETHSLLATVRLADHVVPVPASFTDKATTFDPCDERKSEPRSRAGRPSAANSGYVLGDIDKPCASKRTGSGLENSEIRIR